MCCQRWRSPWLDDTNVFRQCDIVSSTSPALARTSPPQPPYNVLCLPSYSDHIIYGHHREAGASTLHHRKCRQHAHTSRPSQGTLVLAHTALVKSNSSQRRHPLYRWPSARHVGDSNRGRNLQGKLAFPCACASQLLTFHTAI